MSDIPSATAAAWQSAVFESDAPPFDAHVPLVTSMNANGGAGGGGGGATVQQRHWSHEEHDMLPWTKWLGLVKKSK